MPRRLAAARVFGLWIALAGLALAQEPAQDPETRPEAQEKAPARPKPERKPRREVNDGTYMGRPIAPVMTFEAADWLFRPEREEEEHPDEMLDALKLKPGDVVADVGAGAGYTSLRLAKRVGPKGKVLATDVQPQMLQMLVANARAANVKNIQPIRCTASDTKLPKAAVDLALMVDVYHECSQPRATLQGIRKALKPGGRLVLVEFRAEDPAVPIKPEHKMTLAQVRREVEPEGFTFQQSLEMLPWQHVIIFTKPRDDEKKPADSESKPSDEEKKPSADAP